MLKSDLDKIILKFHNMETQVMEFLVRGYKFKKGFCVDINCSQYQMKLPNFENWCFGELSKFGHHFSNKVIEKLMSSKNVKNKKLLPK